MLFSSSSSISPPGTRDAIDTGGPGLCIRQACPSALLSQQLALSSLKYQKNHRLLEDNIKIQAQIVATVVCGVAGAGVGGTDPVVVNSAGTPAHYEMLGSCQMVLRLHGTAAGGHRQTTSPIKATGWSVASDVHPGSSRRPGRAGRGWDEGSGWRASTDSGHPGETPGPRFTQVNDQRCHQRCHLQHGPKDLRLCRTEEKQHGDMVLKEIRRREASAMSRRRSELRLRQQRRHHLEPGDEIYIKLDGRKAHGATTTNAAPSPASYLYAD
ncbi:complement C1q-like protein 3 [Lates japonicus]|uniref:Complement C1q-like protein 3 n=1 Tax=Lates japonicus TaxID=270547 RepID=A0AAD3MAT4_LATJO|nr:complement C1q-like protein 3 [Lates japonicus]